LFKRKWQVVLCLTILFVLALGIRVYDLTDLPLDFHPARQFQSMLKARGMYYEAVVQVSDWHTEMATNEMRGQPVQEPEIMEHLAAWTYRLIGREDVFYPRLYAAMFWLLGGVALFLLLRKLVSLDGALLGLSFYLFSPYAISASRAFMPDPLMTAALLWAVLAIQSWSERPGWGRAVVAGLLAALTVYIKLTAVFYIGGAILGLALGGYGFRKAIRNAQFWVMGFLALLPGLIYTILGIYVLKFIGHSAIINRLIPSMLIDPASYIRWNNMIVTVSGYVAFFLGIAGIFLLGSREKKSLVFGLWAGYLLFGFVFIYYFTTHDYYHLLLIPLTAIGLAAIGDLVLRKMSEVVMPTWFFRFLVLLVLFACIGETMWQVRNDFKRVDYRSQAQFWQKLGDELRGYNTLAMTEDYNGRLAYYGWYHAAYMPDLAELTHRDLAGHGGGFAETFTPLIKDNQLFLVTLLDDLNAEADFKTWLDETYPVFDKGDGYIIYDLRQQK
jgi:hypothetical protein